MPHETSFNTADNLYTESEFLKICEDYRVPKDPMRYRDEKFYWNYQCGVHWPNDYIGPDSMTQWIIEGSVGFNDVGLYKISESVRAHAYLILSSQASARSSVIGNMASALTAQSAFLNNFENIVNRRVDIREDIKRYQDTLGYASSKVNNNKILVSDGNFSLGKIENVSLTVPVMKSTQTAARPKCNSNDVLSHAPNISHKPQEPKTITHNDIKLLWYFFLQVVLPYGIFFHKIQRKSLPKKTFLYGSPAEVH